MNNVFNSFIGMFYAVYRVLRLDQRRRAVGMVWSGVCAGFFLAHCSYLTFWKFDYGYNMMAGVAVGILHNLVWLLWSYRNWQLKYPRILVGTVCALMASMSLELLDFPPWFDAIDAHALWHLATAFIAGYVYEFHCQDARYHEHASDLKPFHSYKKL